jgi:hypothetical protein
MIDRQNGTDIVDEAVRDLMADAIPPQVEQRLQAKLKAMHARPDGGPVSPGDWPSTHGWAVRMGLPAAFAAALLLALLLWMSGSAAPSWAAAARAAKAKPWIYCVGKHPAGGPIELWFSVDRGLYAMKFGDGPAFASFADRAANVRYSYRTGPDAAIRKMPFQAPEGELAHLDLLLNAFDRGDAKVDLPANEVRLVKQEHREVNEGGGRSLVYEFTLEEQRGQKEQYICQFRVDPATRLPTHWSRRSIDGDKAIEFRIDYPEVGPADIYALGAPRAARMIEAER